MKKKYRMEKDEEFGMYRVIALRNFGDVKEGDIGGYVETEDNLSHTGNCWIYDDAIMRHESRMTGNAKLHNTAVMYNNSSITDDAEMFGDASLYNHATLHGSAVMCNDSAMYNNTEMFDHAQLYGSASLFGNAMICDNAIMRDSASLHDNSRAFGNAELCGIANLRYTAFVMSGIWNITPLQISGSKHFLNISSPTTIKIGCKNNSIEDWLANYPEIGKNQHYSTLEILEYKGFIDLAIRWLEIYSNQITKN